ncbi:MAG: hypothetical protein ACRDJU_07020 [Actinomycetota bacterium]
MAKSNPAVKGFVGIPEGPDGALDRDRLAQSLRYGFRVIRWHLEPAEASQRRPGRYCPSGPAMRCWCRTPSV